MPPREDTSAPDSDRCLAAPPRSGRRETRRHRRIPNERRGPACCVAASIMVFNLNIGHDFSVVKWQQFRMRRITVTTRPASPPEERHNDWENFACGTKLTFSLRRPREPTDAMRLLVCD